MLAKDFSIANMSVAAYLSGIQCRCLQQLVPAHFRDLIYQEATCGTEWQFARKMKFPKGTGAVKPPSIAGRQGGESTQTHATFHFEIALSPAADSQREDEFKAKLAAPMNKEDEKVDERECWIKPKPKRSCGLWGSHAVTCKQFEDDDESQRAASHL